MKVKDKENLNDPLQGWQILSAISSMAFHTVHWGPLSQLSINGVWLTKPLTTSLNQTSKHSSHLRKPSRVVGRGEVGITGYQTNIDAW